MFSYKLQVCLELFRYNIASKKVVIIRLPAHEGPNIKRMVPIILYLYDGVKTSRYFL